MKFARITVLAASTLFLVSCGNTSTDEQSEISEQQKEQLERATELTSPSGDRVENSANR